MRKHEETPNCNNKNNETYIDQRRLNFFTKSKKETLELEGTKKSHVIKQKRKKEVKKINQEIIR